MTALYDLAVELIVWLLRRPIAITTELIWGGDDHASPQPE